MKIDFKYSFPIISLFFLLFVGQIQAQVICPSIDCGNLNVNFNNAGEVVFCEGSTVTLFNESAAGFDFFVIDWGDGTIDTLNNYNDATHTYDIPDSLVCQTPQQSINVRFQGVATCAAGSSCQEGSYGFGIKPEPFAQIGGDNSVCITNNFRPNDQSCHADTYLWDFGDGTTSTEASPSHLYSAPGQYTVTQTVSNTCGSDQATKVITVVGEPVADFTQSAETACANTVLDFTDQSNEFSNITWTITPFGEANWNFTDTLMNEGSENISVRFRRPQTYNVRLTASNVCGNDIKETEIIVEEAPVVSVSAPASACDQLDLTTSDLGFTVDGAFETVRWEFVNGSVPSATGTDFGTVSFNQSGSIKLIVEGSCGTLEEDLPIVVNQSQAITMPQDQSYCAGSGPDTLRATPTGGTWSGNGVSADGVFQPSIGAGTYELIYRLDNAPCNDEATIQVQVIPSETVTVNDQIFCIDTPAETLTVSPPGGTWSGTGIADATTGLFAPAQSGVGNFSPTYSFTDANGCAVEASPAITVEALPQISITDTLQLCLTDANIDLATLTNIAADPAGGIFSWSGPGVTNTTGTFNAASGNLALGLHDITVAYRRNQCFTSAPLVIELINVEPLAIDPQEPVCIAENTLQLTANLSGIWSGPGIDENTGLIDLNQAGGNIHTYTLDYAAGTSCAQSESIQVEVIDLGAVVTAGAAEAACEGPATYTLSGASPVDGFWSGTGIINAGGGVIDLTQLTPGETYSFEYCVESQQVSGCSACSTKTFAYNPKPVAGFVFEGNPCIDETFSLIPDQLGFNYSWDFGDGTTSTLESPTHTYTTAGTKTLVQIIQTDAACADTLIRDLVITSPPTAAFDLLDESGCAPFTLNVADNSFGDDITRQWCINGDTLDGPGLPNYLFDSLAQTTDFPIFLKVTNLCGTRVDSAVATVRPYPLVNFGLSEDEGCSPFSPDLINITQGEADTYTWQLGDGTSSNEFEPALPLFTTPDDSVSEYTIQLIASNACGIDTATRNLSIYPPDVEAFIGLDTLGGCQPFTLTPQSFSTPGSILTWEVVGSTGQVSGGNGPRPEIILPDPGIYSIVLFASRCGTDTDTAQVEVLPAPQVDFAHEPQVCLGDSMFFQNTSVAVGNSQWDFGDSTTSNAFNAVHSYDSTGVFTVTYTGASLGNNCPATASSTVTVLGLPESSFTQTAISGCPPLDVTFNNQSSGVGTLNYIWDFGDGSNRSFDANPTHEFLESGVFEVILITLDEASCFSDTATSVVTIFDEPVSNFSLSKGSFCIDQDTITVIDQSLNAVSRSWRIGGEEVVGPNPFVIPTQAGAFSAQLIVTNDFGCRDTSSRDYVVQNAPRAMISAAPAAICAGGSVDFLNQSTFADNYIWDFGDGTGSAMAAPQHIFVNPAEYVINLIAQSDNGCPNDTAFTTVVVNPNPVASFNLAQSFECGAPAEVVLTNNSVGNLTNEWQFGDGSSSSTLSPSHIYDFSGTYNLSLITTSDFGCQDTTSQVVDVFGDPVAVANLSTNRICAGMPVTLIADPTQALRYEWYFDNSLQADTGRVVTYRPNEAGVYDLRLIAIYNDRCRDTLDLPSALEVFEQAQADFDYAPNENGNIIGDVRFINQSTNASTFFWDLGDGTTSTASDPEHEYDANRDIQVQLIAYNGNSGLFQCTDTIVKPVAPEWITTFEVPNAVSPDFGDPAVREFGAVGSGVLEYSLRVYSPFGTLVWSTSALDDGHPSGRWSGNYNNNQPVPQGAYTWEAQVLFVNGEKIRRQGTVTVLR